MLELTVQYQGGKTLTVNFHSDVCSAAVGILQGVEGPGSVYSIMTQWWHLMVLQYIAASFHLPSVSTANINTVQYTKPHSNVQHHQSQLFWYPRCCFLNPPSWQPLFTATDVSCLMSLQVCKHTAITMSHNIKFYSALLIPAEISEPCLKCPNPNI